MKRLTLIYLLFCFTGFAQNENCFFVQGVVKDALTNEILPGSVVQVFDGDSLVGSYKTDEAGGYKFNFKKEEIRRFKFQARSYRTNKNQYGKDIPKYLISEFIDVAHLYKGKSLMVQDIELYMIGSDSHRILPHPLFEHNSSQLTSLAKIQLNSLVNILHDNPLLVLEMYGLSNSNEKKGLGAKRSQNAIDYLISKGVKKQRLILGYDLIIDSLSLYDLELVNSRLGSGYDSTIVQNMAGIGSRAVFYKVHSVNGEIDVSSLKRSKINNRKFVYGFVKDMFTKESIGEGKVVMVGSDGSKQQFEINYGGMYYFETETGVTYQIQASSDITLANEYSLPVLKYFASEKALIQIEESKEFYQQDLELETICNNGFGDIDVAFEINKSHLLSESKIKLNALVQIFNDNSGIEFIVNFHRSDFEKDLGNLTHLRFRSIQNYLVSKEVDPRRLIKGKTLNEVSLSQDEKEWISYSLPDYEVPEVLNMEVFNNASRKEQEVLKYLFAKIAFQSRVNSSNFNSGKKLIKGSVWDVFEGKMKPNLKVYVSNSLGLKDSVFTNSNGEFAISVSDNVEYIISAGGMDKVVNLKSASVCNDVFIVDFSWFDPYKSSFGSKVYGTIKDIHTRKSVPSGKVVKHCSDGTSEEYKLDSSGTYFFEMSNNVTCQLQAISEITEKNQFGVEVLKYYGSAKELVSTSKSNQSKSIDIFLDPIVICVTGFPKVKFLDSIAVLDNEQKIMLNGAYQVLSDNPTLKIELNFDLLGVSEADSLRGVKRLDTVKAYLVKNGVLSERIVINYGNSDLNIHKDVIDENLFYPQLHMGQSISVDEYFELNKYTRNYIDTLRNELNIKIISTSFKP